jgi:membrane associated rhomboid family serine protease
MSEDTHIVVRVAGKQAAAHESELVLLSQGLSPRLEETHNGILICVPRDQAEKAHAVLAAYDRETSTRRHSETVGSRGFDLRTALIAAVVLLCFFAATVLLPAVPWLERGSANAAKILDGESWRSITALFLHADVAHALGNACALAIFLGGLAGQLGGGVAALLVLLTGAAGNLANAYLRGAPHDAVGASTAIFGAVGILGVLALGRRRRSGETARRGWPAVAASLALLGMLGSSGTRVDVLAHLLGFLGGALSGTVALRFPPPGSAGLRWLSGAAAAALIGGSWLLALG